MSSSRLGEHLDLAASLGAICHSPLLERMCPFTAMWMKVACPGTSQSPAWASKLPKQGIAAPCCLCCRPPPRASILSALSGPEQHDLACGACAGDGSRGPHLASLGLHDLGAAVLGALGEGDGLLVAQVLVRGGLAEEGQDGDARVAAHHRHLHIRDRDALRLSVKRPCSYLQGQASVMKDALVSAPGSAIK